MIDCSVVIFAMEQEVSMMTQLESKAGSCYERIVKRSFSTSLVMAALATLCACESSSENVEAQIEIPTEAYSPSINDATEQAQDISAKHQSEMFAYLDESELIDAYYDVQN